jgi:hypothetical protein
MAKHGCTTYKIIAHQCFIVCYSHPVVRGTCLAVNG